MSEIRVDNITNEAGTGAPNFPLGADGTDTTPIGGYVIVQSNLTGAEAPDPETHILLTAGEDGVGEYNEGKLANESVSGSAPLVEATAEIADSESPMNGQTVQLVNTENRYLMPGASPGTVAFDQMQQITGTLADTWTPAVNRADEGAFSTTIGASNNRAGAGNSSTTDHKFDSADSPDARTGDHTSPKRIEVTVYQRIK